MNTGVTKMVDMFLANARDDIFVMDTVIEESDLPPPSDFDFTIERIALDSAPKPVTSDFVCVLPTRWFIR